MSIEVADPDNQRNPAPAVSVEQLNAHVAARKADLPCEACGRKIWLIAANSEMRGLAFPPIGNQGQMAFDHFFAVVPLVCRGCGAMRFFATVALDDPASLLVDLEQLNDG